MIMLAPGHGEGHNSGQAVNIVAALAEYRPLMRPYYYDPSKYRTYLEQLGIHYPTVKPRAVRGRAGGAGRARRRASGGRPRGGGALSGILALDALAAARST